MARIELIEGPLVHSIVGAFYDVYNTLGFGFLESLYSNALAHELTARGHRAAREVSVCVHYKGRELGAQRLDLVVDDRVVVELKATISLPPVAHRQLYNYIRASGLEVGLLLHFGPEPAFHRIICSQRRRFA